MNPANLIRFVIASGCAALLYANQCGMAPAWAATDGQTGMTRQLLMRQDVPPMGPELTASVIRVQFASGYKTPLHTHAGPGPRYVTKGRLRIEDAGKRQTYGPGDVFWETGAAMTVESVGGGDAEIIIFELAPTGSR